MSRLAALLLPLALLGACGDDSGSAAADPAPTDSSSTSAAVTPTESSSEPSSSEKPKGPQCEDVWVDGKKLPWGYEGCYDGDRRVKANGRYCEIGKPLITYREHWYATPGGPVNETEAPLDKDPDYQQAVRACGG